MVAVLSAFCFCSNRFYSSFCPAASRAPRAQSSAFIFGLPGGCLSLTLGLTGAEGIQKTLVLGDLAGRSEVYAMVRGQDAVFVLELDALELLLNDLGR